jgi:hypothetical protein
MLLGNNEKRYAWQDEGFTTFWSTLCLDALNQRSNGPRRDVLEYAGYVRAGFDAACMRHADAYGDDDFGFASYTKPAAVLHQLRGLLGDETFFRAFRAYAADWACKHPYPYVFFHAFAAAAGQVLQPYFRTWLFETWTLEHAIAKVDVGSGKAVVTVEDRGRAVHPCIVEATFADGSKARQTVPAATWWQNRTATLSFDGEVTGIEIDPDVTSLDADRKNNRWRREGV